MIGDLAAFAAMLAILAMLVPLGGFLIGALIIGAVLYGMGWIGLVVLALWGGLPLLLMRRR